MAKYIPLDAIVAEIKRRYKFVDKYEINGFCAVASRDVLVHLMNFINTLEVKEVDLENEIDKFYGMYRKDEKTFLLEDNEECVDWKVDGNPKFEKSFAKYFFELGLRSTITEEDCKLIWNIGDEIPYMPEEKFFKELLRRYKAKKGE